MSNIWERFDEIASKDEVSEARDTARSFEPLDAGEYIVSLESIEAGESSTGLPMMKTKFRTDGNRVIFYNQLLQNLSRPDMTAVNIAEAVEFLSGLTGEEIEFTGVSALATIISGVPVNDGTRFKVRLSYGKNDYERKYAKLKVLSIVKETESNDGFLNIPDGIDDELPFN